MLNRTQEAMKGKKLKIQCESIQVTYIYRTWSHLRTLFNNQKTKNLTSGSWYRGCKRCSNTLTCKYKWIFIFSLIWEKKAKIHLYWQSIYACQYGTFYVFNTVCLNNVNILILAWMSLRLYFKQVSSVLGTQLSFYYQLIITKI